MNYMMLVMTCLLSGCQTNSLDRQVDISYDIDATFCQGLGVTSLQVGKKYTTFTCNNTSRFTLPAKSSFGSDAGYIGDQYEVHLDVKDALCPDLEGLPYEYTYTSKSYLMECIGVGRTLIQVGPYRNTIYDQLDYIADLSTVCTNDGVFQVVRLDQPTPRKKLIKFKCGQARYDISDRIDLDDIESINALTCDYSGFTTFTYRKNRATFRCGNGVSNTIKL